MTQLIAIATGGALGAMLRHLVFIFTQRPGGPLFPVGTLTANLLGCLAIGLLWYFLEGSRLTHEWRLFLFTGLLGGFTTFSTFARETLDLIRVGEWKIAAAYVMISNTLGILLAVAGMMLARRLHHGL
ncbi:fluoride efflux transporter CrcB [Desulfurivibrio alkaliphilus]|nr:fluoride efflux transporter CrcB [Desulfurivibrio alkaliphilus]